MNATLACYGIEETNNAHSSTYYPTGLSSSLLDSITSSVWNMQRNTSLECRVSIAILFFTRNFVTLASYYYYPTVTL